MKTTTHLALFLLTTACAAHIFAGDAKVTLDSADGSSAFLVRDSASNELARVQSDGKVGIGTTTPVSKLHIYGTQTGAAWAGMGAFGGASNAVVLGQYNNKAYFGAHNAALDAWADLAINPGGGNVGIGMTTTPAYKLDVAGSINATAITINGTPVASSTDTYWSTAGGGAIQYSGGNVGVGTATPSASAALEVTATDKGMLVPRLTQTQRDAVASPATGLLVYQTDNNPGFYFYDGAQWSSISAGAGAVTDVSATAPLASSGGTTPTLSMPAATSSANGYLTSTDWTTFNNKVATTRTVSTTAPLTGGGALSGNLTLAMPAATTSVSGYLTSGNWTTFNAKESALTFSAPLSRSVNAISIPAATASVNGYLSSTDWTTFNNKVSAGANSTITSLSGLTTDLSVAQGGTGASTLTGYVIGNGTSAMTASATIPGSAISGNISGTATKASNLVGGNNNTLYGAMPYQYGVDLTAWVAPNTTTTKKFLSMTGSGVNGATPVWDTAAAPGANSDITSLSGLTTDITVAQGGTGASTASAARTNLGAAAAGANSDITSLSGLTTDLSVAQGGTGASTLTANKVLVGNGASTPLQPTNLHWDNANSRLGIGDTTPSYTVDVAGDVNVTGAFRVNGTAVNSGSLDYALARMDQSVSTSGISVPWGTTYLRGQITTNTTKTAFLLIAGKTYELECALVASSGLAQYRWTASDSTSPIGSPSIYGTSYPTTYSATSEASQPKATTIFTPSTNTFVRVYISLLGPGASISTGNIGCYAIIRELR